jgi:cell division protein FtsL
MLGTMRAKAALILPFLCLAAAPVFAQSQSGSTQQTSDPVADAARKAREEKKTAPKPKKVYTDDDIPRAPRAGEQPAAPAAQPDSQGQPAAQGAAPQGGTAQPAGDTDVAAPGKNDEQTWRARFKAHRDKIARVEKELDILQREADKTQSQYYADPQKALAEQNTRKEINEKDAKIAAKKKELDDLKQGLADLEDQLRKSGGDSGWARE